MKAYFGVGSFLLEFDSFGKTCEILLVEGLVRGAFSSSPFPHVERGKVHIGQPLFDFLFFLGCVSRVWGFIFFF